MSVRFGCALVVFLCSGCAGSVASSPPANLSLGRHTPVPVPEEQSGTQRDPGLLAICQDTAPSPELRLAWSTRANGTRSLADGPITRAPASDPRAPECVALRSPSVDRK